MQIPTVTLEIIAVEIIMICFRRHKPPSSFRIEASR